ncbi:MAG: AAA family ATPase, partial [Bradymonadaceae bacterium]
MLSHLVIRHFAIIEQLEIPFRPGYTVVTGETGAGKSIIVDALNLILGGRASTDVIRTGEGEATVEGIFEPGDERLAAINGQLDEQGIETGDELIIRRRVRRNGRNKVFINGSLSTVSSLREITRGLVDISGQHQHYSLLDADGHVDVLDRFAELGDERDEMAEAYGRVHQLRSELQELQTDTRDRLNRIDFLEYQLSEIEDAGLEPGEEEELEEEFNRLKHAESIGESAQEALRITYEGKNSAV